MNKLGRPRSFQIPLGLNRLLLLGATWILLEVFAQLAFQPLTHRPFEHADLDVASLRHRTQIEQGLAQQDEGGLFALHPFAGYTGRAGSRPWPDQSAVFSSFGLLGPEELYRDAAKDRAEAGRQRTIAILGGSVAESFALSEELPKKLRSELDAAFTDSQEIRILPLAMSAYKQPQQMFLLQYALLLGIDIDLVLNLDGFNELALAIENTEADYPAIYPSLRNMGPLLELNTGRLDEAGLEYMQARRRSLERESGWWRISRAKLIRQSRVFNLIAALRVQAERSMRKARDVAEQDRLSQKWSEEDIGPAISRGKAPVEAASEVWARSSTMLDAVCDRYAIPYLHVLQPNQYHVQSKTLTEEELRRAYTPDHPWAQSARSHYPRLIEEGQRLKRSGINFHDLSLVFEPHPSVSAYIDTCCHLSDQGNAILADAIVPLIVEALE